jgi:predicted DNA-binding ribbon-helix-helix protein
MLLISAMKKEQHASDIVLLFNGLTDELLLEEKFVTELESTSSIARRRECITNTRYVNINTIRFGFATRKI